MNVFNDVGLCWYRAAALRYSLIITFVELSASFS
jgi:hypothetical protein